MTHYCVIFPSFLHDRGALIITELISVTYVTRLMVIMVTIVTNSYSVISQEIQYIPIVIEQLKVYFLLFIYGIIKYTFKMLIYF